MTTDDLNFDHCNCCATVHAAEVKMSDDSTLGIVRNDDGSYAVTCYRRGGLDWRTRMSKTELDVLFTGASNVPPA